MAAIDNQDLEFMNTIERDEFGHLRLAEVNSAAIIKQQVRATLADLGIKMTLVDKELGYELRCADPCAFDIDYTRTLGQAAVDFLLQGGSNAMITLQNNDVIPIPYDELMDPDTGRTEVRVVRIDSFTYTSARRFMVRLEERDLTDQELVQKMSSHTNLSPGEFVKRFGYLAGIAPRPF
jgi:6-phosphofructokinase 1